MPNVTSDLAAFVQHLESMYQRLGQLYADVDQAEEPVELFPNALKELGFAAEELQVASEELRQQNEQILLNLADSEIQTQHYQSLFDDAPQAQLITTTAGKILAANQQAIRLLQLSSSNTIDRLIIRFIPLTVRTAFRSHLTRLQQSQQPQIWASSIQLQMGERIAIVFTASIAQTEATQTVHWILQEAAPLRAALMQAELTQEDTTPEPPQPHSELDRYPRYRYSKGDTIPLQPHTVCYVAQGLVKITTLTANNEEVLLGLAGRHTPFLPGSTRLLTYQAIALTDVQLVAIAVAEVYSNLASVLLPKFLHRLQQSESLLNVAGQRRTKDRLFHLLRLLADEAGESIGDETRISVRMTHEDLANACCTTRVTVTRLLGELQRQQKIRFDHKFHIILRSSF